MFDGEESAKAQDGLRIGAPFGNKIVDDFVVDPPERAQSLKVAVCDIGNLTIETILVSADLNLA